MTDVEISIALALAIGWDESAMRTPLGINRVPYSLVIEVREPVWMEKVFDYRDWNVIGPVMERYSISTCRHHDKRWDSYVSSWSAGYDTPQKSIAMAVIRAAAYNKRYGRIV